jgi:hypothetical protein
MEKYVLTCDVLDDIPFDGYLNSMVDSIPHQPPIRVGETFATEVCDVDGIKLGQYTIERTA